MLCTVFFILLRFLKDKRCSGLGIYEKLEWLATGAVCLETWDRQTLSGVMTCKCHWEAELAFQKAEKTKHDVRQIRRDSMI